MFLNKVCVIRSNGAGVFVGTVVAIDGDTVTLKDSRRIWYWEGAATLSQLAVDGIKAGSEDKCRFPCAEPLKLVFGVVEVTPCTDKAAASIFAVPVWKA